MSQKLSPKAMAKKRAYRRKYNATPKAKKNRAQNNKARRMLIKKHGKAYMDGKDADHITSQKSGGKTVMSNLRARSIKKNRGRKPKKHFSY